MIETNDILYKVKEILSIILDKDISDIPSNAGYGNFEGWDSINQMNIISAIEEEYSFEISNENAIEMISVELIVEIIKENLKK